MMGGLELLGKIREDDSITRFIILSECNDFESARAAIRLDVEGYILKPVNEEELHTVLQSFVEKLEGLEKERDSRIDGKVGLLKFLSGMMDGEEAAHYLTTSELARFSRDKGALQYAAIMNVAMESMKKRKLTDVIRSLNEKALHLQNAGILLLLHLDDAPGILLSSSPLWFMMRFILAIGTSENTAASTNAKSRVVKRLSNIVANCRLRNIPLYRRYMPARMPSIGMPMQMPFIRML